MTTTNNGGVPGLNTSIEKGQGDYAPLTPETDTNSADFRSHGPIQQVHDGRSIATARLALASDINQAHQQAIAHADKAVDYARQAGDLLLKVKADLPHGEFLPWLAANCIVSDRQARRYMAASLGKPTPVRKLASTEATKSDTVSVLPAIEIAIGSVGL